MIFETEDRVPLTVVAVVEAIRELRAKGFGPRELRVTEQQREQLREDAERTLRLYRFTGILNRIDGVEIVVEDGGHTYFQPGRRRQDLQDTENQHRRFLISTLMRE